MNKDGLIDGLRSLADWLEQNPDALALMKSETTINLWVYDKDRFRALVSKLGACEKDQAGGVFWVRKRFGPINLEINTSRENVCERKVTKRTITEEVPDLDGDVPMKTVEREVEDIEWDCPDSLLKEKVS